MESASPFSRLTAIMELLRHEPSREQIVQLLSELACPEGEIAGVTTSFLDDEGLIRLEYAIGFSQIFDLHVSIKITDNNPRARTFRAGKITYLDVRNSAEKNSLATTLNYLTDYQTTVGIPVSQKRVYGLALASPLVQVEKYKDYFECLRAILMLWETMNDSLSLKSMKIESLKDKDLSERQSEIVKLIKIGETNHSIGLALGFSESLIRQETIIIYKKLGISGRKDLLERED